MDGLGLWTDDHSAGSAIMGGIRPVQREQMFCRGLFCQSLCSARIIRPVLGVFHKQCLFCSELARVPAFICGILIADLLDRLDRPGLGLRSRIGGKWWDIGGVSGTTSGDEGEDGSGPCDRCLSVAVSCGRKFAAPPHTGGCPRRRSDRRERVVRRERL